ncbi:TolC family protein [bacterium]|nr:TolC family protein [bacterium]MBU1991264.1 TolC family protein [bacterium]
MFRIIWMCLALLGIVQAQNIQEIISHSLENHNSLKSIEQKLSGFDEEMQLSRNFQNPELSLSIGDIQFAQPLNRSIEPMQFTSLTLKQKIPYFGKRDASSSLVRAQKNVVYTSFEAAKTELVKEIRLTAYTIWEYEQKLAIVKESVELIKANVALANMYSSSGSSRHVESMSMELSLSEMKIKQSRLKSMLPSLYARLSYLAWEEIASLEIEPQADEPKSLQEYLLGLKNNKTYKENLAKTEEKNALVELKVLDSKIDPFVSVAYFNRESFNDYMSVSVGASLPIYSSESLKEQRARKEVLEAGFRSKDVYEKLKSSLHQTYATLLSSYEAYKIIEDESLPELEHMLELAGSMRKNTNNLLLYTGLLEKKLALTEQKISALASYKRSIANIEALLGETQ